MRWAFKQPLFLAGLTADWLGVAMATAGHMKGRDRGGGSSRMKTRESLWWRAERPWIQRSLSSCEQVYGRTRYRTPPLRAPGWWRWRGRAAGSVCSGCSSCSASRPSTARPSRRVRRPQTPGAHWLPTFGSSLCVTLRTEDTAVCWSCRAQRSFTLTL